MIHVRRSVWHGQEVSPKTPKAIGTFGRLRTIGYFKIISENVRLAGFSKQNRYAVRDHDILENVLYPICDHLKIERGGMHAFRHGRISVMQQGGAPPDFTKRQVGHSSLRTTSNYTHFGEAFNREIVEKLAAKSSLMDSPGKLDSVRRMLSPL